MDLSHIQPAVTAVVAIVTSAVFIAHTTAKGISDSLTARAGEPKGFLKTLNVIGDVLKYWVGVRS